MAVDAICAIIWLKFQMAINIDTVIICDQDTYLIGIFSSPCGLLLVINGCDLQWMGY